MLGARDQLVRLKRQLYGQIRGLLRPFGIKIASRQGTKRFDEKVRAATNCDDLLYASVSALLEALAAIEMQVGALDMLVEKIVQKSKACWYLMSVPGVSTWRRWSNSALVLTTIRQRFHASCMNWIIRTFLLALNTPGRTRK